MSDQRVKMIQSLYGENIEMSNEQRLANVIVSVAAADYINALLSGDPYKAKHEEQFFYTGWYKTLTDLDEEVLIEKCQKCANELRAQGKKHFKLPKRRSSDGYLDEN